MANTFVYELASNLYINLTNRCSNSCAFCERTQNDGIGGNVLWLEHEPTAHEVLFDIDRLNKKDYNEAVFCGFGEPTERLDTLLTVAEGLKNRGFKTRLNTNGQSDLINAKDTAKLLLGKIDIVSISLNQCSPEKYQTLCSSRFGEKAFLSMLEFAKNCRTHGIRTIFSVVDIIPQEDIKTAKQLAEQCNVEFKLRPKY